MWEIIVKITSMIKMAFISFAMAAGTVVAQPVVMKLLKFVAASLFALPLLSFAALQNYTIPSTTVGSNTISGTFTYDDATFEISNPNIVVSGSVNKTYSFVGSTLTLPTFAVAQTAAVGTSGAHNAIAAQWQNMNSNSPSVLFITFDCSQNLSGGLCRTGNPNAEFRVTVSATPAALAPIPTMSEWSMIFMASLLAMFGIRRMRRTK